MVIVSPLSVSITTSNERLLTQGELMTSEKLKLGQPREASSLASRNCAALRAERVWVSHVLGRLRQFLDVTGAIAS